MQYRSEQNILKEDMLKNASVRCIIPFDHLRANFIKLSKLDDMIVAENNYLSWNSGSFAEIRIARLTDENWVCLYWERASWVMTDSVMKSICASNNIQLPPGFQKMKPHGIAIYSQGNLHIYPAILKDEYTYAFLKTVLSNGSEFKKWVKDYYEGE